MIGHGAMLRGHILIYSVANNVRIGRHGVRSPGSSTEKKMGRQVSHSKVMREARAKRTAALGRPELAAKTAERVSPAGPTSMAIKVEDPSTRAMIEAFLARRSSP